MKGILLVAALLAAIGAAAAQPRVESPVAVHVDHLPHHVRDRVRAHADQGITSLARYLELTRTVYQLRLMDVVAGYDRSSFAPGGQEMTERQVEEAIREGKARPVR